MASSGGPSLGRAPPCNCTQHTHLSGDTMCNLSPPRAPQRVQMAGRPRRDGPRAGSAARCHPSGPRWPQRPRLRPGAPPSRCGLYGVLSVSPLRVAGHQIANEVCIYQTQRDHPPERPGHVTRGTRSGLRHVTVAGAVLWPLCWLLLLPNRRRSRRCFIGGGNYYAIIQQR